MPDFAHLPSIIRLGDLEVPRLGFGAMQIPGPHVWGEPRDPDAVRDVLRRVVEVGIQLIDSSWYYGPHVSNRFIAETLHPYPKGLVLATKLGGRRTPDKGWAAALRPEELRRGCEEDLVGLRLERIDVVHLRWIEDSDVPFAEALDALIDLQKQGKIRHLALSNVTLAQIEGATTRAPIVAVQNLYNVRAGEKKLAHLPYGTVAQQEQIVDWCHAHGVAFLPFFPLAIPGMRIEGDSALAKVATRRGATEAQVALAWLLARSPAMLPIPGTSTRAHLDENWAARKLALSNADVDEITQSRAA